MNSSLVVLAVLAGLATDAGALTNKVLIIGIDGTMPSALAVARTPNLDALKSNGCYSVRGVTHPVTHSAACWSSFFTGVWGDKHGVNDPGNSFSGHQFAAYPSFFRRLETAHSNLNTLAFARWAPMLTAVPEADVKLSFASDAAVTIETCRRLTNSNPDVFWMLLLDVDSAGHNFGWGPTVSNYVRAIEIADGRVGQIIGALTNRVTYSNENWLVIVQSDHGEHDHPDPERSRIVFSIYSGPAAARGVIWPAPTIVDACATVLSHLSVPIDPAWNMDAHAVGLPLPLPRFGTNLIFNGDAEANSGTNNYTTNRGIAWWFDLASTTLGVYGSHSNFPSATSPGPTNRGANFFLGGTAQGSISQRIALSSLAADVDGSGVDYILSGWFGGAGAQADHAVLAVQFLSSAGAVLGSNAVGNASPNDRFGVTGLLERSTNGLLPTGTRFVDFTLTHRVASGQNDASADNLSFVLTPRARPPSLAIAFTNGVVAVLWPNADPAWRLHWTDDLSATPIVWNELAPPYATDGTNCYHTEASPRDARFYRLRKP
ncbi:MAG: alkaline phosphatase family protein [Verrucomicrobia bacterium]|nr:alkaline phosphatase family protein [Verrucomicrobiota bacterium]